MSHVGSIIRFGTRPMTSRGGRRTSRARAGQFGQLLLFAKVVGSLLTVYIYGRFTTFSDSERYLSAAFAPSFAALTDRTLFTDNCFALLKLVLRQDILVHVATSAAVGVVLWWCFRRSYQFVDRTALWLCLLLPHFLVWTGIVAKEPIAVIGFIFVIKGCVEITVHGRTSLPALIFGILLGLLMRPNFAVAYGILLAATCFFRKSRTAFSGRSSNGQWTLVLIVSGAAVSVLLWATLSYWEEGFLTLLEESQYRFFVGNHGRTTRYYVEWLSVADFLGDAWWGIPVSIIGPTFSECLERMSLFPVFVEGIVACGLIMYTLLLLHRYSSRHRKLRPLICLGFIPALIVGLFIHYMLGVFNPGSATRYKQSLAPLFYFYPLLLIAESKARDFARTQSEQMRTGAKVDR